MFLACLHDSPSTPPQLCSVIPGLSLSCHLEPFLFIIHLPLTSALFFFLILLIYSAVLGHHCFVQAFSSYSRQGLLCFIEALGFLSVLASLVAEHSLGR